jgi:simple sugar transport system ATP-binding protein
MRRPGGAMNAIEMIGITKIFPGVIANDHVDFSLRVGEIHALLGENGAGKSTLMKILAGLYRQEAGSIGVKGKTLFIPMLPLRRGSVHQYYARAHPSVTENILPVYLNRPASLTEYDRKGLS